MALEGGCSSAGHQGSESEEVIRAKYHDYCSAQVADILLLLSPDEMFVLARDAARDSGKNGELDFEEIVKLATDRIFQKLPLPPYTVWSTDYRDNPDRYDQYLLGLWKMDLSAQSDG